MHGIAWDLSTGTVHNYELFKLFKASKIEITLYLYVQDYLQENTTYPAIKKISETAYAKDVSTKKFLT